MVAALRPEGVATVDHRGLEQCCGVLTPFQHFLCAAHYDFFLPSAHLNKCSFEWVWRVNHRSSLSDLFPSSLYRIECADQARSIGSFLDVAEHRFAESRFKGYLPKR